MKFTDRKIKNLKPDCTRYALTEGNGLGIRVTPKGTKSWFFVYRFGGKLRRMTFGRYPKVSVASAHKLHGKALESLERGIDPGAVKVIENKKERNAPTVEELCEEYIEKWAKPRKKSWKEDVRVLNKDVLPKWKNKKAKDIVRRDVVLLLDEIVERGAPIQANRTLAVIRRMYNFAIGRDIVHFNPCAVVQAPGKENQKNRVLSSKEIYLLWTNLSLANDQHCKISMDLKTALALKLQLVTAQRKGEIVSIEWSEIDLSSGWWTIPATKTKNGMPHRVPLSSLAVSILKEIKRINFNTDSTRFWLFPSPRTQDCEHIAASSVNHAVRRNQNYLGIDHFTPHDLRRTAASFMTSLGIPRFDVAKVLNHAESDVTAVYDRHSYDREKRRALDLWGKKLEEIIGK